MWLRIISIFVFGLCNSKANGDIERSFCVHCVHFTVHNEQPLGEFWKLNFEILQLEFQGWQNVYVCMYTEHAYKHLFTLSLLRRMSLCHTPEDKLTKSSGKWRLWFGAWLVSVFFSAFLLLLLIDIAGSKCLVWELKSQVQCNYCNKQAKLIWFWVSKTAKMKDMLSLFSLLSCKCL